jgi:putative membrane protein
MFSEEDMAKVRAAVQAAETRTRGEIVPMVVPASARYREASHLAGLIAAFLVLAVSLAGSHGAGYGTWLEVHDGWIMVAVVVAYVLGSFAGTFSRVVRLLTSDGRMAMKVRLRAERAFYEEGLHRTREATGLLIILSLLERRVQILADRAIDERVPPGTWDALVGDIVTGVRAGRPTEALCDAIGRCGTLLASHFPVRDEDNPNELPDDLVRGT